jgi:hypothetical protein
VLKARAEKPDYEMEHQMAEFATTTEYSCDEQTPWKKPEEKKNDSWNPTAQSLRQNDNHEDADIENSEDNAGRDEVQEKEDVEMEHTEGGGAP